jgi:hypothetical protein
VIEVLSDDWLHDVDYSTIVFMYFLVVAINTNRGHIMGAQKIKRAQAKWVASTSVDASLF